jgi:branched-subunit amino acid aminotransferase/4-amino-4-deoxychorismate lyase
MQVPVNEQICNLCGVFDTANVLDGNVKLLESHVDRLLQSCKIARITLSHSKQDVIDIAE